MTYLLDTNAFVDHLRRGPASKVTAKLLAMPPGSVCLCSVVLGELIFGAIRSGPLHEAANRARIAGLQALFPTIPFDEAAAAEYGKLRAYLSVSGSLIGPNDLMIAAITLAAGATLVTHNTSESVSRKRAEPENGDWLRSYPAGACPHFQAERPREGGTGTGRVQPEPVPVPEASPFSTPSKFSRVPGLILDDWQS